MNKTKIFITRHGVTTWNKEGRMQGQADIPLHAEAFGEVTLLAHNMREHKPIHAIYTSHLLRAIQTGQILQDVLNVKEFLHLEELAERGYGSYEGRIFQEVIDELEKKGRDFFKEDIEGVEAREDFRKRIVDSFEYIYNKHHDQTVIVVTHGGVLHHLLAYFNPQNNVKQIPNSSLFLYLPDEKQIRQIS